jgi:hypothetical protein
MVELSNIQVSEGSVTEPVSLDEAKAWCQIDFTDHDSLLTSMINGARKSIEGLLNLHLVAKAVTLDVTTNRCNEAVTLPYCKGMTSVNVDELDDHDQPTTLVSGTDYYVRGNTLRLPTEGRYAISYTTVPGTTPEDLKEAIKMEVAERYSARGENEVFRGASEVGTGLSEAAKAKAQPYRIDWL